METCGIEINDLPNEIIIKILRFLDHFDLKLAILTCKLWKNLIESTCRWSATVNCTKLYDGVNPLYNFLATTDRKFRTIILRGGLQHSNKVIEIVRRQGFIVELSLVDVQFGELTTFAQILSCLINLKKLTLYRTSIVGDSTSVPVGNELPLLPKLEALQIAASEYVFLKCLPKAKLRSLKVVNSIYPYSHRCDTLENFLKNQDRLSELALRSVYTSHSLLFTTTNLNDRMPFQLTRLSLLYVNLTDNSYYSNLLKFIEKHSKSLIELELGHQFHHTIYECVFAKMTHLKTLNLMLDEIPQNAEMLGRLRKNVSVKNLTIKQTPSDTADKVQFFRDFFKCLPNVTNLTVLMECPKSIFEVIAATLTQLKVLQVAEYLEDFCGIRFPILNALHIDRLYGDIDWQAFSKAHPRLTELTIQMCDLDFSGFDVRKRTLTELENMTSAMVHLHTLRFGDWIKADAAFFEIVRKNCPRLTVLELHKDCALPNEQYDQLWPAGALRFLKEDLYDCYVHSPFWNGRHYDEDDSWDESNVRDIFDYNVMGSPLVGLGDNMLEDSSDESESDDSNYSNVSYPWEFSDDPFGFFS